MWESSGISVGVTLTLAHGEPSAGVSIHTKTMSVQAGGVECEVWNNVSNRPISHKVVSA